MSHASIGSLWGLGGEIEALSLEHKEKKRVSLAVVSTMLAAAALIAALSPIAYKIGLVDRPNERKAHLEAIPLVGGLGIFVSFLIATLVIEPALSPATTFLVASAVIVAGGLVDDFRNVPPMGKLVFQVIAVLIMCLAGGVSVQTLGEVIPGFGAINLGFAAIPFTLIAAIGVINAVNLSDGLDGLAGFQVAVAFAGLAFLASGTGDASRAGELLVLLASVGGFLFFNARVLGRKKAAVFLGDAGTTFLGFAYVWFAIDLSNGSDAVMSPVTALWLLAFPICDAVTMMIRRVLRGRSPFKADKEHLHHVLMMAGFTVGETVMILTGMAVAAALIGIGGEVLAVPDAVMFGLFLIGACLYLWVILRSWAVMKLLRWSICRRRLIADRRTNTDQRKSARGVPDGGVERRKAERRRAERRTRHIPTARPPAGAVARPVPGDKPPVTVSAEGQPRGDRLQAGHQKR